MIDLQKHIWEGWTVGDFVERLAPELDCIMSGRSWHRPFTTKQELATWCRENQPNYKKAHSGSCRLFCPEVSFTLTAAGDDLLPSLLCRKLVPRKPAEDSPLQIHYTHNMHGELVQQQSDRFCMSLAYESPLYVAPSYSGNIVEWTWQYGDGDENTYAFSYDNLSRLTNTKLYLDGTCVDRFVEQGIAYDRNGNMLSLDRSIGDGTGSDFSYMYEGNRLVSLVDSGENYSYIYDTNGNLIHDGANNLDITYNVLNQIEKVNRDGGVLANFSYLANGQKYMTSAANGSCLCYVGSLVYERSSSGQSLELESLGFDGGRFIKTTSGLEPRYFITDHLGSVRVVVNDQGEVLEQNDYYPFGLRWENAESPITDNRYRYNGKEEQSFVSVPYIDYGARMYDPKYGIRWTGVDPLAEKYLNLSPYAYCMGNPIKFVDPNGLEIKGVTNQDAQNFKNDIYNILAADKFANLRALIDITGRTFKSIDVKVLSSALEDVDLTEDESAYISMMTNAINSKNIYKIEYISGDYTSMEGAQAFVNYMNNTLGNDLGDKMITPDGKLSTAWIRKSGNGLNVPTKRGSHSFIGDNLQKIERAVVSGHEVFGHGIPAARKMTPAANNANAIRTENLIRRILNIPQRDGSDHGGYQQGHITNPYNLPIIQ